MVHTSPEKQSPGNSLIRFVTLFAVVIALLHLWAAFYPGANNWGLHLLAFFSDPVKIILPLLMLACLVPSVQDKLLNSIDGLSNIWNNVSSGTRRLLAIIFVIAGTAIFWLAREGTTFLGDGFIYIRLLPTIESREGITSVFRHEPLSGYLTWNLYEAFKTWQLSWSEHLAFAVVSVACGALFMIVLSMLARSIKKEGTDRFWLYAFVFVSGGTQLFFGYAENYSPAYVGYIIFLLTGLLCLRGNISLLIPSVTFAILFVLYFGMLAFLPVLMLLYWDAFSKRRIMAMVTSFAATIGMIALLLTLCAYPLATFFGRFTGEESHIVPLFAPQNAWQGYAMFSYAHLIELVNLQLLISPFAIVLFVILIFKSVREIRGQNSEWVFIVLNACCGLIMITIFQSDIGMSRDWDLLAVFELSIVVATAYLLIHSSFDQQSKHRLFVVITVITLLHTVGFILINANEERAISRFNTLVANSLWGRKAFGVHEELAIYHRDRKEYQEAIQHYMQFLEHDSTNARVIGNLADVFHSVGDEENEIRYSERAVHQGTDNKNIYINLAKLYVRRQRYDESSEMLLKGTTSDVSSADTLTDLGIYSITLRQDYSEALRYFNRAIERDSTYADAYLNAGIACKSLNKHEEMKFYLKKFLELQPNSPKAEKILELLRSDE